MTSINRLDMLKRLNAGKLKKQQLQEKMSKELGVDSGKLVFLSLKESDHILEMVTRSFPSRSEMEKTNVNTMFLNKKLPKPSSTEQLFSIKSMSVYLIFLDAKEIGILELPGEVFNMNWQKILDIEDDGFIVVDTTFSNKMVFQQEIDEKDGQAYIDFAVWGSEWTKALTGK